MLGRVFARDIWFPLIYCERSFGSNPFRAKPDISAIWITFSWLPAHSCMCIDQQSNIWANVTHADLYRHRASPGHKELKYCRSLVIYQTLVTSYLRIYSDVIMGAMASQITSVSIVCSTVCSQIKENIKTLRHWPLWGESTGHRWIPLTKGQWRGKCFHLISDVIIDKSGNTYKEIIT